MLPLLDPCRTSKWSHDICHTYLLQFLLNNTATLIEHEVSNFSTPLNSRQDTQKKLNHSVQDELFQKILLKTPRLFPTFKQMSARLSANN